MSRIEEVLKIAVVNKNKRLMFDILFIFSFFLGMFVLYFYWLNTQKIFLLGIGLSLGLWFVLNATVRSKSLIEQFRTKEYSKELKHRSLLILLAYIGTCLGALVIVFVVTRG
jgi:hypothetical protein